MARDIAVVPGDGIGPEVIDAALPALRAAAERHGTALEFARYDWGSARYRETGAMMPADGLDRLADHDAVLLGAVGDPDSDADVPGLTLPIRKGFDQYACLRPATLFPGVESPLRGYEGGDVDFVVFRENTEGEYADVGGREHRGTAREVAVQTGVFTRAGVERVARAAFETAREREGHVTSVSKSNVQRHSMELWDDAVEDVSEEYPDVELEHLLVDAACMDLVRRPEEFDVLVASNLFGDVLTDLAAEITGGLGLAPSANLNPEGEHPSMFESVHGSAPDIAGQGVANPLATVRAGAMLFDHLGDDAVADALRRAVGDQLADPDSPRTPDLGGSATTEAVAADLRERL